jgi:hypothetical protein
LLKIPETTSKGYLKRYDCVRSAILILFSGAILY